jgi:uncharacterized protein YegL
MAKAVKQRKAKRDKVTKVAHVTLLVDRSGSMAVIRKDVIGGFNQFLRDQQGQEGDCILTVHQFDTQGFDTLFDAMEVKKVREASETDFIPRGGTPLLDAVGRAITKAQERKDAHPDEQPIVVILTDGQENSSREYTKAQIRSLIEAKEAQGWVFTYLGANVNAYDEAGAMGIAAGATQNYAGDSQGTAAAFSSASAAVLDSRTLLAAGRPMPTSARFYDSTGKTAEKDWASRKGQSSQPDETETEGWEKS